MNEPGWLGRLGLELTASPHGTQLSRQAHEGPLRIQRVLTPEGAHCPHLYLLHPPGGVVGGDRLELDVELGQGARALLTTPAAQKLYRSAGPRALISNLLRVGAGAELEWLPSETLAFASANALVSTRVELGAGAAFIGWDIACYGMPARGERFDTGRVLSRFELYRAGTPLAIEALDLGGAELLDGAFGLRGQPAVASLYAVPPLPEVGEEIVTRLRAELPGHSGPQLSCSVSSLGEVLVVRVLGPTVEAVRAPLIAAWRMLRPAWLGREAVPPRIWAT